MTKMLKAFVKLLSLVCWILCWCAVVWLFKKLGRKSWCDRSVMLCYGGLLRIMQIRLTVGGGVAAARPLLLVTNHVSYLDIIILGSAFPIRFTPKKEIESWPLVGWICKLCDAVFVDRRRDKVGEVGNELRSSLAHGEVVCLFPEATTGDGIHLLPFKSGLFSIAAEKIGDAELAVQPAAIVYKSMRRLPLDRTQWPVVAWYGDMALMPHLWHLLKLGSIEVELRFLPPVTLHEMNGRKQLAQHCREVITQALEQSKKKRDVTLPKKRVLLKLWHRQ